MQTSASKTLNQGQQAAADSFFDFLLSDEKEMRITGPGGTGKTHLMGYLIDQVIPQYQKVCKLTGQPVIYNEVHMTATTNKAADVLSQNTGRPCSTIHSFLGLRVVDDFDTGATRLSRTAKSKTYSRIIIFIDEASMEDRKLLTMIRESLLDCKLVHVGDHCQLAPVGEMLPPVFAEPMREARLTEPMRNSGQPALQQLCLQLRHTVETGEFYPVELVPGVIDLVDDNAMIAELRTHFLAESPSRILAYSNNRVIEYNDFVHKSLRQQTDMLVVGETMVNNTALKIGASMISAEEEVRIHEVLPAVGVDHLPNGGSLEYRQCAVVCNAGFATIRIPVNRAHYSKLLRYYANAKDWTTYFHLKNNYADLRQRDACTFHKSQGSTYTTVFIDAGNLSTCTVAETASRLLYVGVSRATTRVVFYDKLADKYGGYA